MEKRALKKTAAALFVGGLIATTGATAMPLTEADFHRLDTNGDGYLSIKEARKDRELAWNWILADYNGDKRIGMAEFSAFERGSRVGTNGSQ